MPVYNAELYIRDSIESILNQTFKNFEFLIYNDGSTDKTDLLISQYKDSRIIYKKFEKNSGYLNILNEGLNCARGKYIARMDADDISLSTRFEEQFNYMEVHKEVGICGSWTEFLNKDKNIGKTPITSDEIISRMFFGSPLSHPTIMMRTEMIRKFGLQYDSKFYLAEDYKLFSEAFLYFKITNLPKVLLKYRIHKLQVSSSKWRQQYDLKCQIQTLLLCKCLTYKTDMDTEWLFNFMAERITPNENLLNEANILERRIIEGNIIQLIFPQIILERTVKELFKLKVENNFYFYYYHKYYNIKSHSLKILFTFLNEKHKPYKYLGKKMTTFFIIKCFIGYHKKNINNN